MSFTQKTPFDEVLELKERVAFLESREVCAAAHENAREYNRNLEARNAALEARCREALQANVDVANINIDLIQRNRELETALQTIAAQDSGVPGSTAKADCMATIARMALRHSTSETIKEYDPGPPDCPHGYWKAHCACCAQERLTALETKGEPK